MRRVVGNKVNLCDSCTKDIATCPATFADTLFGDGFGNDNVCCCAYYEPIKCKEKDREKCKNRTTFCLCDKCRTELKRWI